jgi:hypothetical protein
MLKNMAEQDIENAPNAEDNAKVETTTEETTAQEVVETQETIGEMTGEDPAPRVVDEHIFVAEKVARKKAEKELKALKKSIEEGASQEEISEDIEEISEEYDIDPVFLGKLVTSIKKKTEKELEAKIDSKFGDKDKTDKFETAFTNAFKVALERGPEFQSIANPEIIKTLAKLPQNSKKTVSQLLEETYGNALTGKRTIETTTPGGGKDPEPLDLKRAEQDIEYYKQVMADPKKKAQYNAHMLARG